MQLSFLCVLPHPCPGFNSRLSPGLVFLGVIITATSFYSCTDGSLRAWPRYIIPTFCSINLLFTFLPFLTLMEDQINSLSPAKHLYYANFCPNPSFVRSWRARWSKKCARYTESVNICQTTSENQGVCCLKIIVRSPNYEKCNTNNQATVTIVI